MTEEFMITWYEPSLVMFAISVMSLMTGVPAVYGMRDGVFFVGLAIPMDDE